MILTMGIIRADLLAAKHAIDDYEAKRFKDLKNIAAYHIQQATEKLIKIQIYNAVDEPDPAKMYTHNLERLIVYADSLCLQIDIPDYIMDRRIEISEWEAGSRYDTGFSIRIDILKKTYDEVTLWYRRLRKVNKAGSAPE